MTNITQKKQDAMWVLDFYRSLNETQQGIFDCMVEESSNGKLEQLSADEIKKYTENIFLKIREAA